MLNLEEPLNWNSLRHPIMMSWLRNTDFAVHCLAFLFTGVTYSAVAGSMCGRISEDCTTSLHLCVRLCVWERDWTPVKSKLSVCLLPESPVGENSVCLGAKRDWWIIKACWSFTHREPADHWDNTHARAHTQNPVQYKTHRVPYSQSLHMKNVDCSCWAKLVDFTVCSCRWTAVAFQTSSYRLLLLQLTTAGKIIHPGPQHLQLVVWTQLKSQTRFKKSCCSRAL